MGVEARQWYYAHLAALRERKDDVSLLAGYFLDDARLRLGLGRVRLAPSVDAAWNVAGMTFDNTAGAFSIAGPQTITVGAMRTDTVGAAEIRSVGAEQVNTTPDGWACSWPASASSQPARSSSVRGMPELIFATLAAGCRSSASTNATPSTTATRT